jgi:hypothetical protein
MEGSDAGLIERTIMTFQECLRKPMYKVSVAGLRAEYLNPGHPEYNTRVITIRVRR